MKQILKLYLFPFLMIVGAFGIYYLLFEVIHRGQSTQDEENISYPLATLDHPTPVEPKKSVTPPALKPPDVRPKPTKNLVDSVDSNVTTPPPPKQEKNQEESIPATTSNNDEEGERTLYVVNTDVLNVREGPSTSTPIINQRMRGEHLQIIKEEGQWAKIEGDGWAYTRLLVKQP